MKILIGTVTGIALVLWAAVWLLNQGADNSDSKALGSALYLLPIAVSALDLLLIGGYGLYRWLS